MGRRYNLNDRIAGGSMEPRLNPEFGTSKIPLNAPPRPNPLVRATSGDKVIREEGGPGRRERIGLPRRFFRE